ncbi:MAG: hypothetical protein ACE5DX_05330 [Candidatus Dojkabacteria bacterium]
MEKNDVPKVETTPETQTSPPKQGANKKMILIILGAMAALVICLLVIIIVLLLRTPIEVPDIFTEPTVTVTPTDETTTSDNPGDDTDDTPVDSGTTEASDPRVAYLKNNNVWVVGTDGSNKTKLTTNGTDAKRYSAIAWQEPGILGTARCAAECRLFKINVGDSSVSPFFTLQPFTQTVAALGFAHDGDAFGYLFRKSDDSYEAKFHNGTAEVSVKMWPPVLGRGIMYDDSLEVLFTPDDERVLFQYTFGDLLGTTMVITDGDGTVVREIDAAFNPALNGNDGVYFTKNGFIKYYNFGTNIISNVHGGGSFNGHSLDVSPDGNFVAFWSEDADSVFRQYFWDVASSDVQVDKNVVAGEWINNSDMVCIKTSSPPMGIGFDQLGLVVANKTAGEGISLDNGSIFSFSVERPD